MQPQRWRAETKVPRRNELQAQGAQGIEETMKKLLVLAQGRRTLERTLLLPSGKAGQT